jgi:23S rRNA (uracil1939-C5)-methyltransferase
METRRPRNNARPRTEHSKPRGDYNRPRIEDASPRPEQKRLFVNRSGQPERVERMDVCRVEETCGSCPHLGMNYNTLLAQKTDDLRKQAAEGGLTDVLIRDCVSSPDTLGYRRTAKLAIASEQRPDFEKPYISVGLYQPNTHQVVDVGRCPIQADRINEVIGFLRSEIGRESLPVYNERTRSGLLRYLVLKNSLATNQILLTLVATSEDQRLKPFARRVCEKFSYVNGVTLHINNKFGNAIFSADPDSDTLDSGKNQVLAGVDSLNEKICGLKLRFSSTSFMQVNPAMAEKIYFRMLDLASINPTDVVIDLYCGVGVIGLNFARQAGKVIGVEETLSSVQDARQNAQQNELQNISFHDGRAEDVLPRLIAQKDISKADVVTLNPSRRGCQPGVIEAIATLTPRTILYMSCNARSLVRDLKQFERLGYKTVSLEPFDMFPRTDHYEVLAHLIPQNR